MPERNIDAVTPSENPGRGIEDTSEPEPTTESQIDDVTPSPDPGRSIGGSSGGGSSRRSSGSTSTPAPEPEPEPISERVDVGGVNVSEPQRDPFDRPDRRGPTERAQQEFVADRVGGVEESDIANVTTDGVELTESAREDRARDAFVERRERARRTADVDAVSRLGGFDVDDLAFEATDEGVQVSADPSGAPVGGPGIDRPPSPRRTIEIEPDPGPGRAETSGGITDRIRDIGQAGADRVRGATDTIEETLPGRTGQAAAAGVGVAAIPEPTPATEVGGLGLAAGATIVGGGILATRAVRDSELEIGDATRSELDPTRSRQDVRELGVSGSPTVGTSELEPTGAGTVATELGIGDFTATDELDVTGGGSATGTAERPADDTVVPGDFPLAGRDIPRDPTQEAGGEPSPENIVGGAETATGVTIGSGTGETAGRDRTTGTTVGSGTGTASEILEEVRRDIDDPVQRDPGGAFRPERQFPTGAGAVVGREVGRVQDSQDIDVGVGTGAGVDVGVGGPASDPFAGAVEGQRRELSPTDGLGFDRGAGGRGGFGLDTRQRTGMFEETGTPTDTGTGTEFGPGTDTSTATDTAQATALQADVVLNQRQAMQQELAQPTATEALFANPTLTEFGFGGGTSGGQPPNRPPRPPFDLDELSSDPLEINLQTDEAVFGSGILDGDEALERAFER